MTEDDTLPPRRKDNALRALVAWVLLVALAVFGLIYAKHANAEQIAQAIVGVVVVTLYSEKCATEGVRNLPLRATWAQHGEVIEGCWALLGQFNFVVFYFEDKDVTGLPAPLFKAIEGA